MGGGQVIGLASGVFGAVHLEQVVHGRLVRTAQCYGELGGGGDLDVGGDGELVVIAPDTGNGEIAHIHVIVCT